MIEQQLHGDRQSVFSHHDWVIQCDFDGTISIQDVTDTLLEKFGREGWEQLEEDWKLGKIGSKECMKGQIALLDMDGDELDACLDSIQVDPCFSRFVSGAQQLGVTVQVISDGLDYAIRYILEKAGIMGITIIANHLVKDTPRSWHLDTPWSSSECPSANCKCNSLMSVRQQGHRVLYIGDGSSDFCVSKQADFVLAKAKLLEYCRAQGVPHQAFNDFSEVWPQLEIILSNQTEGLPI